MNRAHGLNFKLNDRVPPDKIALAEGRTALFETRSIDTVGGTTAFDLTRPDTRNRFQLQISNVCYTQFH